jgi:Skp family chaperone for outer membrane proteins
MRRFFLSLSVTAVVTASNLSAAELKIAVVDFHRAFMAYNRRDALQKELDARKQLMNDELAKLEKGLKAKQSDLESLQPGTAKYREKQLELIETETLMKVSQRQFELELEKRQRSHMQSLISEMEKELQVFAKEKGYDLVLSKFIVDPRAGSPFFVTLYNKPELDITAALIERINRPKEK